MISEKENTRLSKFFSLVLRHKPETIAIEVDEEGWTDVETFLRQLRLNGFEVTLEVLKHVVETNGKRRFAFNAEGTKIRANQGHSFAIKLGYHPAEPPPILYHGTAQRFLPLIQESGLQKQSRHHVHLSTDKATALAVGQRYGKPILLQIRSKDMYEKGYQFYQSENNVWLTDHVPVVFISEVDQ